MFGYTSEHVVPAVFTVMLHAMVLVVVVAGWQVTQPTSQTIKVPEFVKAKLVTLEQKKPRKVVKKKPAPKKKPVAKKAAPAKPKPAPRAKPAPALVTPAPDPDKLLREQQEEAARRQQEREMMQAMAEEEAMLTAEDDQQVAESYAALIKRIVGSNWSRPPSARSDMQVVLSIRLVPTGEVVGVEVVKSSGNAVFDRSAVIAVEKAERFPELKDMPSRVFEAYFRRFTLVFKPEDLLL